MVCFKEIYKFVCFQSGRGGGEEIFPEGSIANSYGNL